MGQRLADQRPGRDAEVLHDLPAVDVGTDRLQLLLRPSSAMRASSSSIRRASISAFRSLRVVQSHRVSSISSSSRSPASRTNRRTALSVHPMR